MTMNDEFKRRYLANKREVLNRLSQRPDGYLSREIEAYGGAAKCVYKRAKDGNVPYWRYRSRPAYLSHGDVVRRRDKHGNKRTFAIAILPDYDHDSPWDSECGHGPVSDWTTRGKRPGEVVLSNDGGANRYYDLQEACKIARRDGWGFMPYKLIVTPDDGKTESPNGTRGGHVKAGPFESYHADNFNLAIREVYRQHAATFPSARAYASAAAMADYERLRAWCSNEWHYVGVCVFEMPREGYERGVESFIDKEPFGLVPNSALWGIESDSPEYHHEVAGELIDELLSD